MCGWIGLAPGCPGPGDLIEIVTSSRGSMSTGSGPSSTGDGPWDDTSAGPGMPPPAASGPYASLQDCTAAPAGGLLLPSTPLAPRMARDFISGRVCPRHAPSVEEVALLVTEVVTNAVTHGDAPVGLWCRCVGTAIVVSVSDGGRSHGPIRPSLSSPDAESGRGLVLLEALASDWGIEDGEEGTTVWFALDH